MYGFICSISVQCSDMFLGPSFLFVTNYARVSADLYRWNFEGSFIKIGNHELSFLSLIPPPPIFFLYGISSIFLTSSHVLPLADGDCLCLWTFESLPL